MEAGGFERLYGEPKLHGPAAAMQGTLALDADLALCDLITSYVFAAGLEGEAIEEALELLRLCYWFGFHDEHELFLAGEREHFSCEIASYAPAALGLGQDLLERAELRGRRAGAGIEFSQ